MRQAIAWELALRSIRQHEVRLFPRLRPAWPSKQRQFVKVQIFTTSMDMFKSRQLLFAACTVVYFIELHALAVYIPAPKL